MTDWELLILDDCSSDPAVAEYLRGIWRDPKVIIYKSYVPDDERNSTCRYATQINTGLKLATGKYITYLCDDDWYAPTRLEVMADALDNGAEVVYSKQGITDESGENVTGHRQGYQIGDPWCEVNHSSVMHITEASQNVGGWDDSPEYWSIGDAAFWRKLTNAGYKFTYIDSAEPLDFHRDTVGVNKLGGAY